MSQPGSSEGPKRNESGQAEPMVGTRPGSSAGGTEPYPHQSVPLEKNNIAISLDLARELRRLLLFAEYSQEAYARRRDATVAANELALALIDAGALQ